LTAANYAVAHITGGGMDNVPRVIPANLIAKIQNWNWPELFKEVQKRTQVSDLEMLKTLNCGIGMVLVVSQEISKDLMAFLIKNGESPVHLGSVVDKSSVKNLKMGEDWIYESNS
jgi:phosphoribosylformylglycinamidine cyclo-ligase